MKKIIGNDSVQLNPLSSIDESRWKSRREIVYTQAGILFTLVATVLVAIEQGPLLIEQFQLHQWQQFTIHGIFLLIAAMLVYGGLVYLSTRLGYIRRLYQHTPTCREDLDALLCDDQALTVLVPSFKEGRNVIYQTLMSAALQEYPRRNVVLLIDDAPNSPSAADRDQLAVARELPQHIASLLDPIAHHMTHARDTFLQHAQQGHVDATAVTAELITLWHLAAGWFSIRATEHDMSDHTERLFVEQVLRAREIACQQRARQLADWLEGGAAHLALENEFHKLVALFECQLSSFERKRYVNLSHEPNKAMNLNSYMQLTGKHYHEHFTEQGWWLDEVEPARATLSVPAASYFVTLDADSILLPEYALRLIQIMELPGNERLAVAQTPYSAIPGASSTLERVAGATTDMQYIIHPKNLS
jgi:cellulose synthase/poly-beta-1,6-N-acetylglucosamine synthase-like glycosyltransferase